MNGIDRCLEAFERLKKNAPLKKELANREITSSLVSEEAGLDRGYLKKSRAAHLPLISLIESFRNSKNHRPKKTNVDIERERAKRRDADAKSAQFEQMIVKSLAREMRLANQIRKLEEEVAKLKKRD